MRPSTRSTNHLPTPRPPLKPAAREQEMKRDSAGKLVAASEFRNESGERFRQESAEELAKPKTKPQPELSQHEDMFELTADDLERHIQRMNSDLQELRALESRDANEAANKLVNDASASWDEKSRLLDDLFDQLNKRLDDDTIEQPAEHPAAASNDIDVSTYYQPYRYQSTPEQDQIDAILDKK